MPKGAICCEIGVDQGEFSQKILDVTLPSKLHLVDPWIYFAGSTYQDSIYEGEKGGSQEEMDRRYDTVRRQFSREILAGRVLIHRGLSEDVAEEFPPDYFDWIYIDGNHLYEFVKRDLEI
jgi:hypothetical protein